MKAEFKPKKELWEALDKLPFKWVFTGFESEGDGVYEAEIEIYPFGTKRRNGLLFYLVGYARNINGQIVFEGIPIIDTTDDEMKIDITKEGRIITLAYNPERKEWLNFGIDLF